MRGLLVRVVVLVLVTRVAEESHVDEAEHVKRGDARRQKAQDRDQHVDVVLHAERQGAGEDAVLTDRNRRRTATR